MTIYYLNAGSSTENGLTPATGFHTCHSLFSVFSLIPGDIVEFVDNGPIDDSANAVYNLSRLSTGTYS